MGEEDRSRPKSFGEAVALSKMRGIEDASKMESWLDNYQDKLQDAADKAAGQTENKGFWGNLLTLGTTLACIAADAATMGGCTVAGLVAGTAARTVTDWGDPAEKAVPDEAVGPDVAYYRNKIPGLVEDLNSSKEALEDFHANEWKRDVLLQLNDTWTAARIGSGMKEMGLFSLGEEAGEDTVSMVGSEFFDTESLFTPQLTETNLT